jgi:hypothetical protein
MAGKSGLKTFNLSASTETERASGLIYFEICASLSMWDFDCKWLSFYSGFSASTRADSIMGTVSREECFYFDTESSVI